MTCGMRMNVICGADARSGLGILHKRLGSGSAEIGQPCRSAVFQFQPRRMDQTGYMLHRRLWHFPCAAAVAFTVQPHQEKLSLGQR